MLLPSRRILVSLLLSTPVFGQAPTVGPATPPPIRVPIHTADPDQGQAYGIWAAGDAYKASFHDGMTFVPYLGAEYPHNQPWSWCTTSVRVGSYELLSDTMPVHEHGDFRYEYRFGNVTELYDVRVDGLEQRFVVEHLPAAGDLIVQGAVTTKLASPPVESRQQALTWSDEAGRAIVGYGKAIAFDAVGRRTAVATACSGTEITLTVPAVWLSEATLPVTIDPLLTRVQVASSVTKEMDIAHDTIWVTRNVLTARTISASSVDDDVLAWIGNDDFSGNISVFSDITTTWTSDSGCCAFVEGTSRWVVAFRRYFRNSGTRSSRIRAHTRPSGNTVHGTAVESLYAGIGHNDWRPDIGGAIGSGTHALVVLQREDNNAGSFPAHWQNTNNSECWAVRFDTSVSPHGRFEPALRYVGSQYIDAERPSVNKMSGSTSLDFWLCVAQHYDNGTPGDDWDVRGRRISPSGSFLPGLWNSAASQYQTTHQLGPRIDGFRDRFLASYTRAWLTTTPGKTSATIGERLHVDRFDWPAGSINPIPVNDQSAESSASWSYELGDVSYDRNTRSHFTLAYRRTGSGTSELYFRRLGFRGGWTEQGTLYSTSGGTTTQVASVFDDRRNNFLFAYAAHHSGYPVFGHALEYSQPGLIQTAGTACGPASIFWTGSQQIGSEFNAVHVTGAGHNAIHFLLMGIVHSNTPIVSPLVQPGCSLLIDSPATLPIAVGGSAIWQYPIPEIFPPLTLYFQGWTAENSLFSNTQRLELPIVR